MKVSILIPCYNAEKYLPQCLDSVINQTYKDLQIVLIDDGSQDTTLAIAQEYAKNDSRIEVYHQENQGVAVTRNNLLARIKGDSFLFVDSDDWIEPNMVEYLLSRQRAYQVDVVTCSRVLADASDYRPAKEEIWEHDKLITEFLRHVIFSGALWNKFFKSTLLGNTRFQTDINYGEDALFTWQIILKVDRVCVTDRQLYNHRINENSISAQNWTPEKKGSGHLVWESIVEDVAHKYPQYMHVANARYAIEDMWGIYFAALCKYPYDSHIRERQHNVKKYFTEIKTTGLLDKSKLLLAWIISRCYRMGYVLRIISKIMSKSNNRYV